MPELGLGGCHQSLGGLVSCFFPGGGKKGVSHPTPGSPGQDGTCWRGWPNALSGGLVFQSSRVSWAEARAPHVCRPIAVALLMRLLQQLTGITPILVYLQSIFDSTAVLLVRAQPWPAPTHGVHWRLAGQAWLGRQGLLLHLPNPRPYPHLLCARCQGCHSKI